LGDLFCYFLLQIPYEDRTPFCGNSAALKNVTAGLPVAPGYQTFNKNRVI
jgi:hypothetical protein